MREGKLRRQGENRVRNKGKEQMNRSVLIAVKALEGFVLAKHFSWPQIICLIQSKAIHNKKRGRLTHYVASQHTNLFLYAFRNLSRGITMP
jgi:hypothetical protein